MDSVKIKARLAELEDAKVQKMAELNAIIGAINDCNYWLSEIDKAKPKDTQTSTIRPA